MNRADFVRRTLLVTLAGGMIGAAAVGPAAAAPAGAADPVRAVQTPVTRVDTVSPLDVLPNPLNCLLSTGWALFCLGIPLP